VGGVDCRLLEYRILPPKPDAPSLVGLRVASKDARWSALYREPMTRDFVSSSSNRWHGLWCGPSPPDELANEAREEGGEKPRKPYNPRR
jgi:hypothetical protein